MKKICLFFILMLFPLTVFGEELNLAENAKSAIMIEASTGEILYNKNANERLAPASMTKIMSLILIMENIESGRLKWNDIVVVSQNASSMGGSQIFLEANEMMSVEDLVKGICIASGNDATVALAEKIAGTEKAFVKLMNDKVKELGLKNTNFVNSTGLDAEGHYSTAYDMAMMAKELIKHEKILEFSSIYEDYLRKNTDKSFWLVNTNKLVRFYSYIDGLKTGFTNSAGYCLTATGKKNGMRLITVVMNVDNTNNRTKDTIAMMDYGFNMYSLDKVINKDDSLGNIKINLGKKEYENIVSTSDITVLNNNQKDKRNVTYDIVTNEVSAPVKVGDEVGKINIYEDGNFKYSVPLTISSNVDKANIFMVFFRNLKDILTFNI
ncbi:MAG: D-alanyl-D-alanine carboxypeptidase [Bacilli bacterium]|nr:D-alanyl-D-alanine carboxypeptidase [Bacilli bacterium]